MKPEPNAELREKAEKFVDDEYSKWCDQTEEGLREFGERMFMAGAKTAEPTQAQLAEAARKIAEESELAAEAGGYLPQKLIEEIFGGPK